MKAFPLLLIASNRKSGNTHRMIQDHLSSLSYEGIDLMDYNIAPYSYTGTYPAGDEFMGIVERLLQHRVLVMVTPVYWYAMSGSMKTFFDRLTDLITIRKDFGRKLAGKSVFLMAVGSDAGLPEGFLVPFIRTAEYFGMHFRGSIYFSTKTRTMWKHPDQQITDFIKKLLFYCSETTTE